MFVQLSFINILCYVPGYMVGYLDRRTEYDLYKGYQSVWMSL